MVRCIAPKVAVPASMALEVSNGGVGHFSNQGVRYGFRNPILTTGIVPIFGPETGGTVLTLTGANFVKTDTLKCKFGDVDAAATFITETAVA